MVSNKMNFSRIPALRPCHADVLCVILILHQTLELKGLKTKVNLDELS